eukprot:scaffold3267_cov140-Cylindrotheca_fusiformis.AAC.14
MQSVIAAGANKNSAMQQQQQHDNWKRVRSLFPLFLLAGFSFFIAINTALILPDNDDADDADERKNTRTGSYVRTDIVDVVIVGAGAAGIAAARQLGKSGIHSVTILEASHQWGGRIRKMDHFVDYPIDLGASLIHDPKWFRTLMDLSSSSSTSEQQQQGPTLPTTAYLDENQRSKGTALLVNSTWYDFLDDHLKPDELEILYDSPVTAIDYSDGKNLEIKFGLLNNSTISAKAVIVTVPLSVLKDGDISFTTTTTTSSSSSSGTVQELMDDYQGNMWGGVKIILEFNKTFYPPFMELQKVFWDLYYPSSSDEDEKFPGEVEFWDYSIVHKKHHSSRHVLGGQFVGDLAKEFMDLNEYDMVKAILLILDHKFGNYVATRNYIQYKLVNWSKEPYIRGCYSDGSSKWKGAQKITDRLYLAGEAFPGGHKQEAGWVHSAALSGMDAASKIIPYLQEEEEQEHQQGQKQEQ